MKRMILVVLVCALPVSALAQAMVEYGAGLASSAAAISAGRKTGKSVGGIFEKASKAVSGAPQSISPSATAVRTTRAAQADAAVVPTVVYPPLEETALREGAAYEELVSRYGPPSLETTGGSGEKTAWYETKRQSVEIVMREGKIGSWRVKPKAGEPAAITIAQ